MDKEFERAVNFTLRPNIEGGYSDDPDDPGKETKFGISKKSYPDLDIKNLTIGKAKDIYYINYWLKADCNKLIFPANIEVFDASVHHGVSRALSFYKVSTDWQDYLFIRLDFMTKCKKAPKYMHGWTNRVVALYNLIRIELNNTINDT